MVRNNKNFLPEKKLAGLYKQLDQVLGDLPPAKVSSFLQSLIGPEEKLMLAKRLAVIVMINEGYSDYRIALTLKLSPSTIKNIKSRLSKTDIEKILQNNKPAYIAILEIIDSLLHVGGIMPHRNGLDRYRGLNS